MISADHDARIGAMFDRIAARYDRLNRVLSLGTDLRWRRRAVAIARLGRGERAVDVGAGTGDLSFALLAASAPTARVFGVDISAGMLAVSVRRSRTLPAGRRYTPVIASAEALPLPDASVDRIVSGFTIRNVGDLPRSLAEFRRVLRPKGRAVILELSHPSPPAFARLYRAYFERIAPRLATVLGADAEAYRYLPRSLRPFPRADALAALMRDARFSRVRYERLTLGIAAIHVGEVGERGAQGPSDPGTSARTGHRGT